MTAALVRQVSRRTVTLIALGHYFGIALCTPALAADTGKHEFPYDPAACKADAKGKLYVALGRNVLAVPTSGAVVVARPGKDDKQLAPPDPAEPEGCPGNPEQLSGYAFPFSYNARTGNESSPFPNAHPKLDLLQLIHIPGATRDSSSDGTEWFGERSQVTLAQAVCEKADLREELPNGLNACREGAKDKVLSGLRVEDWLTSYIGRAGVYQTPFSRSFVVNCTARAYSTPIGQCDVAYAFRPGLGLAYRFKPYWGANALPIDQVISFDMELRMAIASSLVSDFRWPDSNEKDKGQ